MWRAEECVSDGASPSASVGVISQNVIVRSITRWDEWLNKLTEAGPESPAAMKSDHNKSGMTHVPHGKRFPLPPLLCNYKWKVQVNYTANHGNRAWFFKVIIIHHRKKDESVPGPTRRKFMGVLEAIVNLLSIKAFRQRPFRCPPWPFLSHLSRRAGGQ